MWTISPPSLLYCLSENFLAMIDFCKSYFGSIGGCVGFVLLDNTWRYPTLFLLGNFYILCRLCNESHWSKKILIFLGNMIKLNLRKWEKVYKNRDRIQIQNNSGTNILTTILDYAFGGLQVITWYDLWRKKWDLCRSKWNGWSQKDR